jgi:hypothetical protein
MEPTKNSSQLNIKVIFGIVMLCIFSFIIGNIVLKIFFSATPEGAADEYLRAWQLNKAEDKGEFSCLSKEPVEPPDLNVQSWEVLGKNEKVKESDLDSKYFEVSVKVQYLSKNDSVIKRTIVFNVWNTDELFESAKRGLDKHLMELEKTRKKLNIIMESLGEPGKKMNEQPSIVITRDMYSQQKYCILFIEGISD